MSLADELLADLEEMGGEGDEDEDPQVRCRPRTASWRGCVRPRPIQWQECVLRHFLLNKGTFK